MSVNTKKKTSIIITIAIIIMLFVVLSLMKNTFVSIYLHDKYDMPYSQIDVFNYEKSHFKFDYGLDSSNSTTFYPKKWTVEYEDKVFTVQRYWFHFVDDYQLEELDALVTSKLQNEIDENITHIVVTSDMIFHSPQYDFHYKLPYSDHKRWSEKNIDGFFDNLLENSDISIFYKTDNIEHYLSNQKKYGENLGNKNYDLLKKEIEEKFFAKYNRNIKITLIINNNETNYARYSGGDLYSCYYLQTGLNPIDDDHGYSTIIMRSENE